MWSVGDRVRKGEVPRFVEEKERKRKARKRKGKVRKGERES